MEDRVAEVTVRAVFPETPPEVAVMVAVPAATGVARPLLLTVATDMLEEAQVTWVVISWLVPSEYVPEAANCLVTPTSTLGLTGVTDMVITDVEPSAADGSPEFGPLPPPHPAKMKKSTRGKIENKSFALLSHILRKAVEFPIDWHSVGTTGLGIIFENSMTLNSLFTIGTRPGSFRQERDWPLAVSFSFLSPCYFKDCINDAIFISWVIKVIFEDFFRNGKVKCLFGKISYIDNGKSLFNESNYSECQYFYFEEFYLQSVFDLSKFAWSR